MEKSMKGGYCHHLAGISNCWLEGNMWIKDYNGEVMETQIILGGGVKGLEWQYGRWFGGLTYG